MRKILSAFSCSVLAGTFIIQAIACTNPFIDPNLIKIVLVTDGHTVTDNSFNQSAYEGANDFKQSFEQWIKTSKSDAAQQYQNKKVAILPYQPPFTDFSSLIQSYSFAATMDASVTVANGFVQQNALTYAQTTALKNNPMKYIFVDGDTPGLGKDKKLAGLLYKAEQAGFLAGIVAIVYLLAKNNNVRKEIKIVTYGGNDTPVVTSYMYGFYWSAAFFNQINEIYGGKFLPLIKSWIKILNSNFDDQEPFSTNVKFIDSLKNYFTGNFDQASPGSKAVNYSIVNKNPDVIFPVAGPQIDDTIGAIDLSNKDIKLVGVDTDQAKQYKQVADKFITSALKKIRPTVESKLWHSLGLSEKGDHQKGNYQKEFYQDAIANGIDQGYVGIADNNAIHPIYQNVMNNLVDGYNLGKVLQDISEGWNKVIVAGKANNNYWNLRQQYNPFYKNQ